MMHFLGIGIMLGLSAGLSPGPLLMLIISETLRHGVRSGVKVALAPIITDLPIILITLFILVKVAGYHYLLGIISLAGGMFVLFMGYASIRTQLSTSGRLQSRQLKNDLAPGMRFQGNQHFQAELDPFAPHQIGHPRLRDTQPLRCFGLGHSARTDKVAKIVHQFGAHLESCRLRRIKAQIRKNISAGIGNRSKIFRGAFYLSVFCYYLVLEKYFQFFTM